MKMMRKILRIFFTVLALGLVLMVLVIFWLQTDNGQNFFRKKTIAYLEKKLGTKVQIAGLKPTG